MACNNTLLTSNTDVLYAIGYTNGRILLNNFDMKNNLDTNNSNTLGLVGKEFSPKTVRPCNTLDFNQSDNNLVFIAHF